MKWLEQAFNLVCICSKAHCLFTIWCNHTRLHSSSFTFQTNMRDKGLQFEMVWNNIGIIFIESNYFLLTASCVRCSSVQFNQLENQYCVEIFLTNWSKLLEITYKNSKIPFFVTFMNVSELLNHKTNSVAWKK